MKAGRRRRGPGGGQGGGRGRGHELADRGRGEGEGTKRVGRQVVPGCTDRYNYQLLKHTKNDTSHM